MLADITVIAKHLNVWREASVSQTSVDINRDAGAFAAAEHATMFCSILVDVIQREHGWFGFSATHASISAVCRVNFIPKTLTAFPSLGAGHHDVFFAVVLSIRPISIDVLMPIFSHLLSVSNPLAIRAGAPEVVGAAAVFCVDLFELVNGLCLPADLAGPPRRIGWRPHVALPPPFMVGVEAVLTKVPASTMTVDRKLL